MSDPLIRKACDRCHHQKLSCKRTNEVGCERCIKLKIDCRWSPSLRFKKNVQQQQQQKALRKNKQKASAFHSSAKKDQQLDSQLQRQPQVQHQLPLHFEPRDSGSHAHTASQAERRSPKRRRTGSDPDLVSPEAGRSSLSPFHQSCSQFCAPSHPT